MLGLIDEPSCAALSDLSDSLDASTGSPALLDSTPAVFRGAPLDAQRPRQGEPYCEDRSETDRGRAESVI